MAIEIVSFPSKMVIFHSYVKLPEGMFQTHDTMVFSASFCCARREMSHPGDPDWEAASVRGPVSTDVFLDIRWSMKNMGSSPTDMVIHQEISARFGISHSVHGSFTMKHSGNSWDFEWDFEWGKWMKMVIWMHLVLIWDDLALENARTLAMAMALFKNNCSMNTSYPWYQLSIIIPRIFMRTIHERSSTCQWLPASNVWLVKMLKDVITISQTNRLTLRLPIFAGKIVFQPRNWRL